MSPISISQPEIYRLVGQKIRGERKRRKLTQEELATLVQLKRTSITNIEKGKQKLLLHTLIQIAAALNLAPHTLLSSFESPDPTSMEKSLPPNLSPSVKHWIISGVSTAQKNATK